MELFMKNQILILMLGASVLAVSPAFAMLEGDLSENRSNSKRLHTRGFKGTDGGIGVAYMRPEDYKNPYMSFVECLDASDADPAAGAAALLLSDLWERDEKDLHNLNLSKNNVSTRVDTGTGFIDNGGDFDRVTTD